MVAWKLLTRKIEKANFRKLAFLAILLTPTAPVWGLDTYDRAIISIDRVPNEARDEDATVIPRVATHREDTYYISSTGWATSDAAFSRIERRRFFMILFNVYSLRYDKKIHKSHLPPIAPDADLLAIFLRHDGTRSSFWHYWLSLLTVPTATIVTAELEWLELGSRSDVRRGLIKEG